MNRLLVWLGLKKHPDAREFCVVTSNCGDSLFELADVCKIPPDVPDLCKKAGEYGYKGERNYDHVILFLYWKKVGFAYENAHVGWRLFQNKPATT